MPNERCRDIILSNDYADFIYTYNTGLFPANINADKFCVEVAGYQMAVVHLERQTLPLMLYREPSYQDIPKLYGFMDTVSVEAVGSLRLQEQPILSLKGEGVLLGLVDTGIDYTHPAFLDEYGQTRIAGIWDQTIQDGEPPEGLYYGTEYNRQQINDALQAENPFDIVPSRDVIGHGTFLAGVAAGTLSAVNSFNGAAPKADIAMVKLKPAKEYLKQFFYVPQESDVCQETDIMMGVRYLFQLSLRLNKPLVLLLGIGSSQGAHDGTGPLARQLRGLGETEGCVVVAAAGNEGDKRHHFRGDFFGSAFGTAVPAQAGRIPEYIDVELRIGELGSGSNGSRTLMDGGTGFALELWGRQPDIFSVGFISPTGQQIARIPASTGTTTELSFIFEETELAVDYWPIEGFSGDELIFMRFRNPEPGIWTIRVYGTNLYNGIFDMWLPIQDFLASETYFLEPDPNITITQPGNAADVITIAGYNAYNGSYFVESGRGFNRDGGIVPDFAAPSVNVTGPVFRGNYGERTGTSIGAALAAGACAQVVGWAVQYGNDRLLGITTRSVRNFLVRGAERETGRTYPNEQWGYGRLNAYQAFEILLNL